MNYLPLVLLFSLTNVLDDEIDHSLLGFGLWNAVPQAVISEGFSSNVFYEYADPKYDLWNGGSSQTLLK